jgi:hypothetical protein
MKLTFSIYLKGFEDWIKIAEDILKPFFTPEMEEEFGTFEDFAVEVYLENKTN